MMDHCPHSLRLAPGNQTAMVWCGSGMPNGLNELVEGKDYQKNGMHLVLLDIISIIGKKKVEYPFP